MDMPTTALGAGLLCPGTVTAPRFPGDRSDRPDRGGTYVCESLFIARAAPWPRVQQTQERSGHMDRRTPLSATNKPVGARSDRDQSRIGVSRASTSTELRAESSLARVAPLRPIVPGAALAADPTTIRSARGSSPDRTVAPRAWASAAAVC